MDTLRMPHIGRYLNGTVLRMGGLIIR